MTGLDDLGSKIAGVLNAHDPEETARTMREERAAVLGGYGLPAARAQQAEREEHEHDSEQLAAGVVVFPTYEVPPFVAERFPRFDPADPSTWPEPDKCTEGRPWGIEPYGASLGDPVRRWENYLRRFGRPCRNRWKDPETRLCGTHVKPYRETLDRDRRRARANARLLRHLDLAKRLGVHGIVADGQASGVLLQADAVEDLLRLLARAGCPNCGRAIRPGERHLVIVAVSGPDDSPEPEYECLDTGDLPLPFAPPAETQTEPDPF